MAASSSSCCLLLSLPLSCVYSVLRCFRSGGGGRWSGKRLTMIPGGGAAVFSSPPLCRARGLFFSSLSVLSCFSSPSLVLLALAALMVAGWWGCWWWLGGTMEALVEVQRWLFSSLFCLALSLSSVSQKTIPRLVSLSFLFLFSSSSFSSPFLPRFCSLLPSALQKISPPSSCLPLSVRLPFSLFLQNFAPPGVPLFLKKSSPLASCALPYIYRQPWERHHTLSKCRAWWRGMAPVQPLQGMAFFSSWWGVWVSCFSINEGMGCVSS